MQIYEIPTNHDGLSAIICIFVSNKRVRGDGRKSCWRSHQRAPFRAANAPTHGRQGRSNGMACQFFWLKSCVGILREIECENALFARSGRPPKTSGAPLGMFRVASGYVLHFDRACSEARKTMYRTSIRHVLWRSLSTAKRQKSHPLRKSLNTSLLGKYTENRVFVPNFSVMKNKRVDSNVVCRNNLNLNRHGRQGAHTMADNNT